MNFKQGFINLVWNCQYNTLFRENYFHNKGLLVSSKIEVRSTEVSESEVPVLYRPVGFCKLELIHTQMAQKPMLRAEVGMRVRCAKKNKFGMVQEGEGHWPSSSENLQKARYLWVLRTPQNNKEEGARAKKLVTCGTRGSHGRGQSVPFSAQGAYCSAPEPEEALTGQELLPRPRSGSE